MFIQQQILFEDRRLREAFRGSSELVKGRWWYALRVAAVFWLIGAITGPAEEAPAKRWRERLPWRRGTARPEPQPAR
jgi:hypothetical protein